MILADIKKKSKYKKIKNQLGLKNSLAGEYKIVVEF